MALEDKRIEELTEKTTPSANDGFPLYNSDSPTDAEFIRYSNLVPKDTDGTLAANSDAKIATQKATKTYADTKQAALGYTAENTANKDTDVTLAENSDTRYPSQKAVKTYIDTAKLYYNVKDYGAVGDGSTDDTAEIQTALDAIAALPAGGTLFFPAGTYICSSALEIAAKTSLIGVGIRSSILQFSHAGDGLTSTFAINSSTAANIYIRDLKVKNTNGSNTGGGYVDVGGTFIEVSRCEFEGFKYGIILDQSELVTLDNITFSSPLSVGLWLVNGADHTIGASAEFTNRIDVSHCQFNASSGTAIADDGGYTHNFWKNNFNGWDYHFKMADGSPASIKGSEFEGAAQINIVLSNLGFDGGVKGSSVAVTISDNIFVPIGSSANIDIVNHGTLNLVGNRFGGSNTKVTGTGNCAYIRNEGNALDGGTLLDSHPTIEISFDRVSFLSGAGSPESSVAAKVGSFYTDTTNGVAYMKKTGTGTTGWKQITQAA